VSTVSVLLLQSPFLERIMPVLAVVADRAALADRAAPAAGPPLLKLSPPPPPLELPPKLEHTQDAGGQCYYHDFRQFSPTSTIFANIRQYSLIFGYYVTVSNPNMQNANKPNVTVQNLIMLTHHSAECTMDPNYNVPKCLGVDATKC
jgi:hypothetical protein